MSSHLILFEDPDFSIIQKPTGITCHNSDNSIIEQLGDSYHLVNRLDKETSGLMLATKKSHLQEPLSLALKKGEKIYQAILRGNLESTQLNWDIPVTDKAESRTHPLGDPKLRKDALSLVTLLQNNQYFTRCSILIKTGYQHQIRKQAASLGRPIVGDARYGNEKDNLRIKKIYGFDRLALHSWKLRFEWNDEIFNFESLTPDIFAKLFI